MGTNNPAQGDCATSASEAATSVGYAVLKVTSSSFQAEIQLQKGSSNTTYGVFMQQVPGSCPQDSANGGTLTTDSSGSGQATTSVPRVPGATIFFVQLVPTGTGPPEYTSDRGLSRLVRETVTALWLSVVNRWPRSYEQPREACGSGNDPYWRAATSSSRNWNRLVPTHADGRLLP